MGTAVTTFILVLCSATAIRVPIDWESASAVTHEQIAQTTQDNSENQQVQIPVDYFQYPAKKPQFAVDVAAYHGVKNPEDHYKAYPVRPYTGHEKPVLGNHKILNENNPVFEQFQQYTKINENDNGHANPVSSDYEVFHPYKAEEPALQELYKDPVLDKIRNDIRNSQNRLQKYEKEAGQPNIQDDEYLESPEQTDRKKFPHRNVPAPYEIHRPLRRPIYYRPSPNYNREHILNQKFRHPWNQHNAKIRPVHYRPLRNHLQRLRQHHALTFDDQHNEYPQVPPPEPYAEVSDGYDIYQRGKEKYVALRNNVDESINKAVKENRPTIYRKLELQNNGDRTETQISDGEEPEFVPIKNYAQVRKTETTRHLPREAAFEDAASFDEIRNAPRLREAIKSTKAQTVYTEEGYEDAAFDHAGEEKHAAENEAHGGYLKEKEISAGKYKAPSLSQKYQEADGNEYRDQTLHGEKWKNDDKEKEEETEEEDYSEDETEQSIEKDIYENVTGERNKRENESKENKETSSGSEEKNDDSKEVAVERSKRENKPNNNTLDNQYNTSEEINDIGDHELNKRDANFKVPELNLNITQLVNEAVANDTSKLAKLTAPKKDNIRDKYPYYFKNLKNVHKDSPLRYAENLKFIPKKSSGGTEFYDSRSILECSEVDDSVDAIPEKLKKDGHPDKDESDDEEEDSNESKTKGKADFEQLKKKQRLKGLGDKIDCFKAKYFGENPLDSPFFKEDLIANPEPVTAPNLPAYKLISKEPLLQASASNNIFNVSEKLKSNEKFDVSDLFEKLKGEQQNLQESLVKTNNELRLSLLPLQNFSIIGNSPLAQQSNVYTDVLDNIKSNLRQPLLQWSSHEPKPLIQSGADTNSTINISYNSFQNKEDVTKLPPTVRKKRATPFVYEPYKIIRDGQVQESKKTTTTSNISPLIKQLQSSKVVDKVTKTTDDQPVKRNVGSRTYKDIGKRDRSKNSREDVSDGFVDVSIDKRRGEPRYEIKFTNHKSKYNPVENKKAMTVEDYEAQTNNTLKEPVGEETSQSQETTTIRTTTTNTENSRKRRPTARPYFDVSQYIPKIAEIQKHSASNTIKKVIKKPTSTTESNKHETHSDNDEEDYDEYDDKEVSTTTTTKRPSFRRRQSKHTTTTPEPEEAEEEQPELPKLRLITRFRSTPAPPKNYEKQEHTEKPVTTKHDDDIEVPSPKYREKKKKSTKSTLVTDTKSYGDGDDDMMKDEVDAMIGVKQNMEEYTPRYEKEIEEEERSSGKIQSPSSPKSREEDEEEDERDSDEDDDDDFDDDEDEEEIDEDDDEDDDDDENISSSSSSAEAEPEITTPEPTKRTLIKTTEAPVSTTESRSAKLELKPIVHKKKIEIHKEIPVNKSSPHITQFKEDIKEIEIIKEMPPKPLRRVPQRIPQKNIEALELYKDENLAKEVNKLGAVEVFKQNLDLTKGPKHGGNYRSAKLVDLQEQKQAPERHRDSNLKIDADTSQTENAKLIDLTETLPARRRISQRSKNNAKSAKLQLDESSDTVPKRLHGGNLRSDQNEERRQESSKNRERSGKLLELDEREEEDDDSSTEMHGGNFKTYDNSRSNGRRLHGGNYRSAKIIQDDDKAQSTAEEHKEETVSNPRNKAALLLSSFVQAAPHITTTPAFILDPSKRMYYYVDT